jgi:aconitase A
LTRGAIGASVDDGSRLDPYSLRLFVAAADAIDGEQVTVSASNRNFPGRSGPGQVWLASPSIVAASAIAGRLCSFDELRASITAQ